MTDNVHLFVLSPPASGSTVLWRLLCTSPNVSHFPGEGQFIDEVRPYFGRQAGEELEGPERWALKPPWDEVREAWNRHWDLDKPVVLEKSPINIQHAAAIRDTFPNARFLITYRNPYAYIEGVTRRHPRARRYPTRRQAEHWVYMMVRQRESIARFGPDEAIHFSYADFTGDPTGTAARILELVPELGELEVGATFRVFDRVSPIRNFNPEQIARLTRRRILEANEVLSHHESLLVAFGYELLSPSVLWNLRPLRAHSRRFIKRGVRKLSRTFHELSAATPHHGVQ